MNIKDLWNEMSVEQRKRLLLALYDNNFFDYLCTAEYDDLIFGVKRRLGILESVACEINK